jgi:hypothetical protein
MRERWWEEPDGQERRDAAPPSPEPDLDLHGRRPPALSPHNMAALQRTVGNQALAGALSSASGRALLQRGKKGGRNKDRKAGGSLADKLATLNNSLFFASHFTAAHVLREMSPDLALAKFRPGKNTSVLFLDGDAYQTLADEVRSMSRMIARKRKAAFAGGGGNPTFISHASFDYITIFDNAGRPQPGKLRHGHLVFAVEKRGEMVWQGGPVPLFAINHCEAMDDTKHPDEPWERQSELPASDAVELDEAEDETEDTDDDEAYESESDEVYS